MSIHPYFKLRSSSPSVDPIRPARPRDATLANPWDVPDLCRAYNWPTGLVGGGVIGIIEMGGGWLLSDIQKFCNSIGQPIPAITDISVDGATNNSPGQSDADFEVALDIQVAACAYYLATGKRANIRIYWEGSSIPNAVAQAAADGCDVFSISWGDDEAAWGAANVEAMEAAAAEAANSRMIIFAAAGDNDSSDGGPTPANVDCPACCPHVIGCGGTMKPESGQETVWNNTPGQTNGTGTGGGFSTIFPRPPWQRVPADQTKSHRMVPDVSANADPNTGYNIVVNGQVTPVGGTSAVAPLYAGLFAAFGRKLGFATHHIYRSPHAFNDITIGNNSLYDAEVGPDPCTGMGSPIGTALASEFVVPLEGA